MVIGEEQVRILRETFNESMHALRMCQSETGAGIVIKQKQIQALEDAVAKLQVQYEGELKKFNAEKQASAELLQSEIARLATVREQILNDSGVSVLYKQLEALRSGFGIRAEIADAGSVRIVLDVGAVSNGRAVASHGHAVASNGLRHNSLMFVLQCSQSSRRANAMEFAVTECEPVVLGLQDLVGRLNSDERPGSLCRFVCRLRMLFMRQSSSN